MVRPVSTSTPPSGFGGRGATRVLTKTGNSWALHTNCPVPGPVPTSPANRDYQPGFAGALMAKDLGLALQAIEQTSTDARMGRLAQEIYAAFAAGDGAGRDFSGIITDIRDDLV